MGAFLVKRCLTSVAVPSDGSRSTWPPDKKVKREMLTKREPQSLSEEQFHEWVYKRSHLPLAVKGHSFILKDDAIVVDGGKFVYEEALELVRLLNSRNPLDQINASIMIAERNGALRVIVLALVAVIIVVVVVLARH